jgi:hypothetical protein
MENWGKDHGHAVHNRAHHCGRTQSSFTIRSRSSRTKGFFRRR